MTKRKEVQPQEKDITEDPNYEPDPADEPTADDHVFVPDEEEHVVVKFSSKVPEGSTKENKQKRSKIFVPPNDVTRLA